MQATQWLGLVLMLLILGGVLYAYLRKGTKIEPDKNRKPEDWWNPTQGGWF